MVLIAVPTTGNIRFSLAERLLDYDKNENVEIYFSQARPVDANRCKIAEYFLEETDHDRLVMIDSDIVPPEDLLEMLDKYNTDVLSPVVFSTEEGLPYPVATVMSEENGQLKMVGEAEGDLIDADGMGTGCIAIKREVFEELEEPYFEFTKHDNGTLNTGEDFNFCLDAKDAGFDVKMATDYTCGHVSEVDLREYMKTVKLALDANPSDIFVEEVG